MEIRTSVWFLTFCWRVWPGCAEPWASWSCPAGWQPGAPVSGQAGQAQRQPQKGELLSWGQTEPKGWEREGEGHTCPRPSSKFSIQVREQSKARGVSPWGTGPCGDQMPEGRRLRRLPTALLLEESAWEGVVGKGFQLVEGSGPGQGRWVKGQTRQGVGLGGEKRARWREVCRVGGPMGIQKRPVRTVLSPRHLPGLSYARFWNIPKSRIPALNAFSPFTSLPIMECR